MGAEIDRLEVQVEAQATKANNQLDKLVGKLDALSSSLTHLNSSGLTGLSNGVAKFAQASSQLSNVKTADFTRLAKNIEKLSSLNTQQIYSAASSMRTLSTAINNLGGVSASSMQVAEVANSISKLGGASVQRAIANLPALATAMKDLMTTLSKAPTVSNNIIQMTKALANLSSQGSKVGTAGTSLTRSVNNVGTAMSTASKKARSFSSVIGSIYQKYFLLMRGASKLWTSIESSMDYVEVLNYFDAAFGQVADKAVLQWKESGYSSAEEYYNSFSSRAKQLTEQMTGFTITDSGMLESTGNKSLGINPSQLMNYQAMFAQMSSSMGVASETSLKLSRALTEIGGDLASVKNMDFDKVWNDMASGLAGMSRTLDKYGVNIRNVNLQQKLLELGINANITALNQNDKALLRSIILLDSTRYAWGDLADTIGQPANQLRLLKANFANLSRTIGNIFLPIVAKVLPYVNGLVIALQRLAEWIVKLLGFEGFDWGGASGEGGSGLEDLIGDIGDTEEGLDDATDAAKKLKHQLQGFDELNVITTPESESSGGSGAGSGGLSSGLLDAALDKILEEYQAAWDEAFNNMEERYNQFADNVADAFKKGGLEGVGEYFSEELTKALESINWEKIYSGAESFGTGLANFLNGLISPELFGAVGSTIANSLNAAIYLALSIGEEFDFYDFGVSIATGINDFFDTFDFSALADTLNTWVDGLEGAIAGFLKTIKWEDILDKVGTFLEDLEIDTVGVLIGAFMWKHGGKALTAKLFKDLLGKKIGITGAEGAKTISLGATVAISVVVAEVAFEGGKKLGEILFPEDAEYYETFHWFGDGGFFDEISRDWPTTLEALEQMWVDVQNSGIFRFLTGSFVFPKQKTFSELKEDFIDFKNTLSEKWDGLQNWWNDDVALWFTKEKWSKLWEDAKLGTSTKWNEIVQWWNKSAIGSWWNNNVTPWFTEEKWNELWENVELAFSGNWDELVHWWNESAIGKWWNDDVAPWFTEEKWSGILGNIEKAFRDTWNNVVAKAEEILGAIPKWIEENLKVNIPVSVSGAIGAISGAMNIEPYSMGGFPEDGLFFANHNELVGQFSNGKTAVANNEQITEGIYTAVRDANYETNSLLRTLIQYTADGKEIKIVANDREIAKVVQRQNRIYKKSTGRNMFDD